MILRWRIEVFIDRLMLPLHPLQWIDKGRVTLLGRRRVCGQA
jgi:hypothetical protein